MQQAVAVVLAAGKGTRMNSELPKVLCPVNGRPMIEYVLDSLAEAGIDRQIVVIGYEANKVREALADREHVDAVFESIAEEDFSLRAAIHAIVAHPAFGRK